MSTPRQFFSIAIVAFGFVPSYGQSPCDHCKQIQVAFYDHTKTQASNNFTNDLRAWLKSQYAASSGGSSGFGFNITVPVGEGMIPFGMNSSDQSNQTVASFLDQGNTQYMNTAWAEYVAKQLVDANAVTQWGKCIELCMGAQKGLRGFIEGDSSKSYFNLVLYWVPTVNVGNTKVTSITVFGGSLGVGLPSDSIIGTEQIRIPIYRTGTSEINITVNAGRNGSYSGEVPSNKPMPVLHRRSWYDRCMEDDDARACQNIADKRARECSQLPPDDFGKLACQQGAMFYQDMAIALQQEKDAIHQFGENSQEVRNVRFRLSQMKGAHEILGDEDY